MGETPIWFECPNCGGRHRNADQLGCEASIRYHAKKRGYHVTKRTDSPGLMLVETKRGIIVLGENYDATLKEIGDYLRDPGLNQWLANRR
jgi:hypothetical protein